MAEPADRVTPLEGRVVKGEGVSVTPEPAASRLLLRAPENARVALGKALGLSLPRKPKSSATKAARSALWLGPDEWLVLDGEGVDLSAFCARVSAFHSAVDVSHRNTALLVEGPRAGDVINAGCPQDLSLETFPVGAVSRTVLAKAEIVLWRTGEERFRVECWRSFSDYVFAYLESAVGAP